MMLVIRISGRIELTQEVTETLHRMRIRRKYAATLLPNNETTKHLINSVRNFVAYGPISEEMLTKLVAARGQPIDKSKKIDAGKVAKHILAKGFDDSGIKPFFRLHPPRKGINSHGHAEAGTGVLGNNKEAINTLVERML